MKKILLTLLCLFWTAVVGVPVASAADFDAAPNPDTGSIDLQTGDRFSSFSVFGENFIFSPLTITDPVTGVQTGFFSISSQDAFSVFSQSNNFVSDPNVGGDPNVTSFEQDSAFTLLNPSGMFSNESFFVQTRSDVLDPVADTRTLSNDQFSIFGNNSFSAFGGVDLFSQASFFNANTLTTTVSDPLLSITTSNSNQTNFNNDSNHSAFDLRFGSSSNTFTQTQTRGPGSELTDTTTFTNTANGGSNLDANSLRFVDSRQVDTTTTDTTRDGGVITPIDVGDVFGTTTTEDPPGTVTTVTVADNGDGNKTTTTAVQVTANASTSTFNGASEVSAQGLTVEDAAGNVTTYGATVDTTAISVGTSGTTSTLDVGNTTDASVLSANGKGLTVTETQTTLSGGTATTTLTLDDTGATFQDTVTGGPAVVRGVADGVAPNDAVNRGQLDVEGTTRASADAILGGRISTNEAGIRQLNEDVDELKGGVALGLAAATHQYDSSYQGLQGSVAAGSYDGESAFSIGLGGALSKRVFLNANVGTTSESTTGGAVAVGFKF